MIVFYYVVMSIIVLTIHRFVLMLSFFNFYLLVLIGVIYHDTFVDVTRHACMYDTQYKWSTDIWPLFHWVNLKNVKHVALMNYL